MIFDLIGLEKHLLLSPSVRLVKKKVPLCTPRSIGWWSCQYSCVSKTLAPDQKASVCGFHCDTGMSFLLALDAQGMYLCEGLCY